MLFVVEYIYFLETPCDQIFTSVVKLIFWNISVVRLFTFRLNYKLTFSIQFFLCWNYLFVYLFDQLHYYELLSAQLYSCMLKHFCQLNPYYFFVLFVHRLLHSAFCILLNNIKIFYLAPSIPAYHVLSWLHFSVFAQFSQTSRFWPLFAGTESVLVELFSICMTVLSKPPSSVRLLALTCPVAWHSVH